MPYGQLTKEDVRRMLDRIGVADVSELFDSIPKELRLAGPLPLGGGLSEDALAAHMQKLAGRNRPMGELVSFMGAGIYDHYIPAVVDEVAGRGEFYSSYTPYQPEISQGNLQAFFEYQSLIAELVGMDVSNASMYDGASALAEAVLMALDSFRGDRRRVVMSEGVHPEYREAVETYLAHSDVEVETAATPAGTTEPEEGSLGEDTAALVVASPNFFGCIEDLATLAERAHKAGALLIVSADPIACGTLLRPGDAGADIVTGEGQALGLAPYFGGMTLGLFAARRAFLRRMPGRIVGETTDGEGRRGYVLTLQTREQHIRREKASSNICTNQALYALRATVYLALMGARGLAEVAEASYAAAHYAAEGISRLDGYGLRYAAPFFKEFVVTCPGDAREIARRVRGEGILAGVPLARFFPERKDELLVACTERRSREEIDRLCAALGGGTLER